jgi:hypothetical protein
MSKKPPVEDTFSMPPALNQAASTDDLMALIRSKQENIKPVAMVPDGMVPNHTEPHYTVADDTASLHATPNHTTPVQNLPPAANLESLPKRKPKTAPWDDANPKVPVGFNFRMDQRLHAKAVWLCENMPAMSQQKLYRMAVEEKIEELLKKYYRE